MTIFLFLLQYNQCNDSFFRMKRDFIMEIAFCRIDDRLIHGQVATVWTKMTGCNRIMCVNDDVAQDEMRKKLLIQASASNM